MHRLGVSENYVHVHIYVCMQPPIYPKYLCESKNIEICIYAYVDSVFSALYFHICIYLHK